MNEFYPKLSVVIPTYNEENHIQQCLESLLEQDYPDFELIVVDDGSTDQTKEIVKSFEDKDVLLLEQSHGGPGQARNLGATNATGDILIFIDADMTFDTRYLYELTYKIRQEGVIGTFHAQEYIGNPQSGIAKCWGITRVRSGAKESRVFRAVKRDAFLDVGGFDPSKGYYDDSTASEKMEILSQSAPNAICYHHNPETMMETFKQTIWIGRSSWNKPPKRKQILFFLHHLLGISFLLMLPLLLIDFRLYLILFAAYAAYIGVFSVRKAFRSRDWTLIFAYPRYRVAFSAGYVYGAIQKLIRG